MSFLTEKTATGYYMDKHSEYQVIKNFYLPS